MGKFQKGILGGFQGRIGNVVGASWKGIDYMKSRNRKSSKPPTRKQIEQQAKFTLLIGFVSSIGKLLMLGFKDTAIKMTGINSAFAYNYDNALTGVYPFYALDYGKVLISKGQLHNVDNPSAAAAGNGQVRFSWTDNSGIAMANATDKCMVVVYCPELKRSVYITGGADRRASAESIDATAFTGKTVETWVGFSAADDSEIATSIYTGQLTVL